MHQHPRHSYYASICCFSQEATKCDNRGHAGTVQEQEGCHTLQAKSIPEVTPETRQLPLNVKDQTPKRPGRIENKSHETKKIPIASYFRTIKNSALNANDQSVKWYRIGKVR